MALTQMALDSLDFDATVALATKVAPHVDILEIGTPCIKHNGIKLLETLRAKFPNNKILVDLKTMDAGYYEAEPFYKAGADICTVLGTADLGTIKGVVDVANKYGKEAQVDLINVNDKAKTGETYTAETDPGVQSVRRIYAYYKEHGYKTVVMGASFRNIGEITSLAGCDRLTIAPALLEELGKTEGTLQRVLSDNGANKQSPSKMTEKEFRFQLNEDAMATEKLSEGIRGFVVDQIKLEKALAEQL